MSRIAKSPVKSTRPSRRKPTTRRKNVTKKKIDKSVLNEDWFFKYWRPSMAWLYLFVIFYDFCVSPMIFHAVAAMNGSNTLQWVPLTSFGGGIFHIAMTAVIGINAWGRTQERLQMMRDPEYGSLVVDHTLRSESRRLRKQRENGIDPDLSEPL